MGTICRALCRCGAAFLLLALLPVSAALAAIDLETPEGAKLAMRKIQCSTVDGEAAYFWWQGKAFARRMGEKDRHLFNIEGMNVRSCKTIDGGKRGKSYRLVSREILLYTDSTTGQPLEYWDNPWSGEKRKVLHVRNDPVNQPPRFPRNEQGKPFPWSRVFPGEVRGDNWWLSLSIPLYYHNVLGGDYQRQIGGVYHATELFNFFGSVAALTDERSKVAQAQVGWVRMADWLPWMMMEGREGIIYMHAGGSMVDGFAELGAVMRQYIERHAPKYRHPPPLDDDRPNETSWTDYKSKVPGAKFGAGGS